MIDALFADFDGYLKDQGDLAMGGQIIDADSAYRSVDIEATLKDKGLKSRIHRKGRRNTPLNNREEQGNNTRSKVRARVEHVFGAQSNDMGGTLVRSIGMARAKARIGLKNVAYNMRRLVQLERSAVGPAAHAGPP